MATVYKIRNKDGLYSTGGSYPHFTKNGKTWNSKAALNNHINLLIETKSWRMPATIGDVYDDCELIEIEISQVEVGSKSLIQLIEERSSIRDKKKSEQAIRMAEWKTKHDEVMRNKPKF